MLPFRNAAWLNGAYVATGDTDGDGRAEIIDGLDAGCCTTLHVLDAATGADRSGFFPYGNRSEVGARVAAGDVNGDGRDEIFAVPLGGRRVSLYAPLGGEAFRSFEPFGPEAGSGVTIAVGDVLGDARPELVATAATGAGVQVRVVDIGSGRILATYRPFDAPAVAPEVAVGDIDGNGRKDVVVLARLPDGTKVRALDAAGAQVADFFVLDAGIVPGASLAAGDLDGDKQAEIVLGGGPTTSPWPPIANGPDQRVAVYAADGSTIGGFTAYPGLFQGGVRVALGDVDGDRRPETITAPGPGMEPEIVVFSQSWDENLDRGTRLAHFLAFEPEFRGGVTSPQATSTATGQPSSSSAQGRVAFPRCASSTGGGACGGRSSPSSRRTPVASASRPATSTPTGAPRSWPGRSRRRHDFARSTRASPWSADRAVPVRRGRHRRRRRGHRRDRARARARGVRRRRQPDHRARRPLHRLAARRGQRRPPRGANGLSVAAGDLDRDGRDELVLAPRWGGGATVEVLDGRFRTRSWFTRDPPSGFGLTVATQPASGSRSSPSAGAPPPRAGPHARVVVARFRDAAGAASRGPFRATIDWGDGTRWNGVVLNRGGGVYDVRSSKRYGRPGTRFVTVTLTDARGRTAVARSTAVVRRK